MDETYNGNPPLIRISYQYANSVYGDKIPDVMRLVGPGYRIWEFTFGYSDISFMTEDYFWNGFDVGLERGDLIIVVSNEGPLAIVVTGTITGGASSVSADVEGFLTEMRTNPSDFSPTYGDLQTNWNPNGSVTYANNGAQDDTNPCPDKSSVNMLVAKYPGTAADPVATSTVTGLAMVCNQVENIVVWMKGTVRSGDPIAQAYPFQLYVGVGGFTKFAVITGLIPPDGEWHPLIFNRFNFTDGAGGFSWSSTDVIDRIRVKPTDVSQNGTVGYNTATTGEVNLAGPVRMNPRARPKFVIRFDDSIGDLVQPISTNTFSLPDGTPAPTCGWSALTLLGHYGFRGSCFHLPRRIGTSNAVATHATWDDLKVLKHYGWANCFQSYYDPLNNFNDGIRLLGPSGYAAKTIASVDTTADTLTASVATGMLLGGTTYGGYPVLFSGTNLPSPLVINKIYWAMGVTSTTFKLYATEQDSINQVNPIDLTTTGTPANFTYRYGFAANDYTKYQEDWTLGIKMLTDNGYGDDALFIAMNQGATDGEVMKLADSMGIKAIFGVYKGATPSEFYAAYPWTENGGTNPALNWKKAMRIPGAVQTDSSGAVTAQDARNYVDKVVAQGSWGMNYHHRITNANGPCLAALLDQLKKHADAGDIDVITAPELPLA